MAGDSIYSASVANLEATSISSNMPCPDPCRNGNGKKRLQNQTFAFFTGTDTHRHHQRAAQGAWQEVEIMSVFLSQPVRRLTSMYRFENILTS